MKGASSRSINRNRHPDCRVSGLNDLYLLKTGSVSMPPSNDAPDTVEFSTKEASVVQAAMRLRNRGMEAQICDIMSL